MYKVKSYLMAISIMLITSVISLFVLSLFTYAFKWQADKAMIGIIVTYVIAGVAGGFCLQKIQSREDGIKKCVSIRKKMIEALILSGTFMISLMIWSGIGLHHTFQLSSYTLLIWILIASSAFGAMYVKK